jgi:hypothetical protein
MTERYEPPNTEVEQLLALAKALGLEPDDLDDAVHDLAQEVGPVELDILEDELGEEAYEEEYITAQEEWAIELYCRGLEDQVAFLLEYNGYEGTRELLELAAAGKG